MSGVEISYKGEQIASMDATGVKTLLTGDTFCEDDIVIQYTAPSAPTPTGTKQITISGAGTVTEDVANYANAEITTPAGTAGTPTASKGAVSNHAVSVTPSVTNSAGWVGSETKNGTPVSVTAGELVSGTKNISISAAGTTTEDVTNYASAKITVPSGSATTPATTVTANPSISVNSSGLITATVSKTQSVTPTVSAGYVSSGTAGNITVSGSNTSQLPTQAAQTITPTTADQTIASGKYLAGTQTIKGDANLLPENIVNGVTIFGVTGTAQGGGGGDMYDIVIKCTNANGFSNTASDYVVETGSYDDVVDKLIAGDRIDGIAYCRKASYDDEDEYWAYQTNVLRLQYGYVLNYENSGYWEGLALQFRGDAINAPNSGAKWSLTEAELYINKMNDDPDLPITVSYKGAKVSINTP